MADEDDGRERRGKGREEEGTGRKEEGEWRTYASVTIF
jgi:hypothetical protein